MMRCGLIVREVTCKHKVSIWHSAIQHACMQHRLVVIEQLCAFLNPKLVATCSSAVQVKHSAWKSHS